MLTNYKTILFDIDDTLLDFQFAQRLAFEKLLAHVGIPYQAQYYSDYHQLNQTLWKQYEQGYLTKTEVLTKRFTQFFAHFNLSIDATATDTLYRQLLSLGNQLFPDTLHVVKTLSNSHELAIITNGVQDTQLARLKNNHLYPWFKGRIFISDSIGYQKPDPQFFNYVINALHITHKQSALIVGDSIHADIYGGNLSQIDTCWVNPQQLSTPMHIQPTYTISSLIELLQNK